MELKILCGLPGSGKTYFAEQEEKTNNSRLYSRNVTRIEVIDVDLLKQKYSNDISFKKYLQEKLNLIFSNKNNVILDGLFLFNETYEGLLNFVPKQVDVEFHYWKPNVEFCLYNDDGRRKDDSIVTIKAGKIDKPNIPELLKFRPDLNIKLICHEVMKKPEYKKLTELLPHTLHDNKYIYGEEWSLGGNCRDCWGGEHSVTPDPQPKNKKLVDILRKVAPNMTFFDYEDIVEECVSIEEKSYNDYYGGTTRTAYYVINMEKLHNCLKEKEYIK